MSGKAVSIQNDYKINFVAREIADFQHRGSATVEKLSATLSLIRETTNIKTLKNIEQSHINQVISVLQGRAEQGGSLSAINSHISSLNNIVRYLNRDGLETVKAGDYNLSRDIKEKDLINKENTREAAQAFKDFLASKYIKTGDLRFEALRHTVAVQNVNLRLKESLLVKLNDKDLSNNILKINEKLDGAKNSRAREIHLTLEQKQALLEAREFLKDNNMKNLNIGTVQQGRNFANNTLKMFRKETNMKFHYHGERHWTTHEAYKLAWQDRGYAVDCRARTGEIKEVWESRILSETGLSKAEFKAMDRGIKQDISENLGHERLSITERYLG